MLPFSMANVRTKKARANQPGADLIPPVRPSEYQSLDISIAAGSFFPAQHTMEDIPVVSIMASKNYSNPNRRVVSMPVFPLIETQKFSPSQAKAESSTSEKKGDREKKDDKNSHIPKANGTIKTSGYSQGSISNRQPQPQNGQMSHDRKTWLHSRPLPGIEGNRIAIAGSGSGALPAPQHSEKGDLDPKSKANTNFMGKFRMLVGPGKKSDSKSEKRVVSLPAVHVPPPPPPKDKEISQPTSQTSVQKTNLANALIPEVDERKHKQISTITDECQVADTSKMAATSTMADATPTSDLLALPQSANPLEKLSSSALSLTTNTPADSILQAYFEELLQYSQRLLRENVHDIVDAYMSLGSKESVTSEVSSAPFEVHSGRLEEMNDIMSASSVYSDDDEDNINDTESVFNPEAKRSAGQSSATVYCTLVDRFVPQVPNPENPSPVPLMDSFLFSVAPHSDESLERQVQPQNQHKFLLAQFQHHPENLVSRPADPLTDSSQMRYQHHCMVQAIPLPQQYRQPHSLIDEIPPPPPPHSRKLQPPPPPAQILHNQPFQHHKVELPQTVLLSSSETNHMEPNSGLAYNPKLIMHPSSRAMSKPLFPTQSNVRKHRVPSDPIKNNRHLLHEPLELSSSRSLENPLSSVPRRRVVSEFRGSKEPTDYCLDMGADYRTSRFMIPKLEAVRVSNDYSPQNRQFSAAYMNYRNKSLPVSPTADEKKLSINLNEGVNGHSIRRAEKPLPRPLSVPVFLVKSFTNQKEEDLKERETKHRSLGPIFYVRKFIR